MKINRIISTILIGIILISNLHIEQVYANDYGEIYDETDVEMDFEDDIMSLQDVAIQATGTVYGDYRFDKSTGTILSYYGNVTNLVIPGVIDGVTVERIGIEHYMVCSYSNLKTINIPSSVSYISDTAFLGNPNLTSITVSSDNLYFSSLKGVLFNKNKSKIISYPQAKNDSSFALPITVNSIYPYAFFRCRNLTTLELTETISAIPKFCFFDCSSLEQLVIPDGVESIGEEAFSGCHALTNIIIPSSVISIMPSIRIEIGGEPFDYYYSEDTFYGCAELSIYCQKDSYAHQYALENNINFQISTSVDEKIMKEKYFSVYQLNPDTLQYDLSSDALVTYGDDSCYTNEKGTASISSSDEMANVLITKEGYQSCDIPADDVENYNKIYLDLETMSYIKNVNIEDMECVNNFVVLIKGQLYNISIDAILNEGVSISEEYLEQDNIKIPISSDAMDITNTFDFKKQIYACVELSDGTKLSKELRINAIEIAKELSLGESVSGISAEGIPLLDDAKFEMGFLPLPVSCSIEDNKIKLVVGVTSLSGDPSKMNEEDYKNEFDHYFNSIKDVYEDKKNEKNKMLEEFVSPQSSGYAVPAEIGISGYCEGIITNDGEIKFYEGGLMFSGSLGYEYTGVYAIGAIPAYWELYFKAELEAKINFDEEGTPTGIVEVPLNAGGGTGIGVKGAVSISVGVEGELKPTFDFHKHPKYDFNTSDMTLDGKVSVYFKVQALLFKLEKYFPVKETTLYPSEKSASTLEFYNEDDFAIIGREYNSEKSNFNINASIEDDSVGASIFSSSAMDSLSDEETVVVEMLKSNVYPNTQPQIINLIDNEMLAIWEEDDSSRTSVNRTSLMYSFFDGTVWSNPQYVENDGTADFGPIAKNIDGTVYLVWQDMNIEFGEDVVLNEMASHADISFAIYDKDQNNFVNITNITNNTVYDGLVSIDGSQTQVNIAWASNTESDIFGVQGVNSINSVQFNSTFEEIIRLKDNVQSIDDLSIKTTSGSAIIAYSVNTNNDINDGNDNEIFILKDGLDIQITDNDILDSNPIITNDGQLYWYSDGVINRIVDLEQLDIEEVISSDNKIPSDRFKVFENENDEKYICVIEADGRSNSIVGYIYDSNIRKWSEDVNIYKSENLINSFDGYVDSNLAVRLLISETETEAETELNEMYGETNIKILKVKDTIDLKIQDQVYFEEEMLIAGNRIEFVFDVVNNGLMTSDNQLVEIEDLDGNVIHSVEYAQTIKSGETNEFNVGYIIPDDFVPMEVMIRVTPLEDYEINLIDNEVEVELSIKDVAIETVDVGTNEDGNIIVKALLVNRGYENVQNFDLNLLNLNNDSLIECKTIVELNSFESKVVSFNIDDNILLTTQTAIYLSIDNVTDESSTWNNDYLATIFSKDEVQAENSIGGYVEWKSEDNDGITVNVYAGDDTTYLSDDVLYTTTTDSDGQFNLAVDEGTYKVEFYYSRCLKTRYTNVIVGSGETISIGSDTSKVQLLVGDVNEDGNINIADYNTIKNSSNFNKTISAALVEICDVNGDGNINMQDANIVRNSSNFNKTNVELEYN